MTTWAVAPWLLFCFAAILAIAAAWPPIHPRRMVAATVTLVAGLVVLVGSNGAVIWLPTRLIVVAECGVYGSPPFGASIAEARRAQPPLSSVRVLVLAQSATR